ncbi:MAG: hypothetical protein AAFP99_03990 [Pseudomonadota bacterium]
MMQRPSTSTLVTCAIAAIFAVGTTLVIGAFWGFVALAGLFISGNMVAWFGRHPPPPSSFRGGKKTDD